MHQRMTLLESFREARKSSIKFLEKFLAGDFFSIDAIEDINTFPDAAEFKNRIEKLEIKEKRGECSSREILLLGWWYWKINNIDENVYYLKQVKHEPYAVAQIAYWELTGRIASPDKKISLETLKKACEEDNRLFCFLAAWDENHNALEVANYFLKAVEAGNLAYAPVLFSYKSDHPAFPISLNYCQEMLHLSILNGHPGGLLVTAMVYIKENSDFSNACAELYIKEVKSLGSPTANYYLYALSLKKGFFFEASQYLKESYLEQLSKLRHIHATAKENISIIRHDALKLSKTLTPANTENLTKLQKMQTKYNWALVSENKEFMTNLAKEDLSLFIAASLEEPWELIANLLDDDIKTAAYEQRKKHHATAKANIVEAHPTFPEDLLALTMDYYSSPSRFPINEFVASRLENIYKNLFLGFNEETSKTIESLSMLRKTIHDIENTQSFDDANQLFAIIDTINKTEKNVETLRLVNQIQGLLMTYRDALALSYLEAEKLAAQFKLFLTSLQATNQYASIAERLKNPFALNFFADLIKELNENNLEAQSNHLNEILNLLPKKEACEAYIKLLLAKEMTGPKPIAASSRFFQQEPEEEEQKHSPRAAAAVQLNKNTNKKK